MVVLVWVLLVLSEYHSKKFPVDDTQHQDHLKFLTKSHSKKGVDVDCYDFDCWF